MSERAAAEQKLSDLVDQINVMHKSNKADPKWAELAEYAEHIAKKGV